MKFKEYLEESPERKYKSIITQAKKYIKLYDEDSFGTWAKPRTSKVTGFYVNYFKKLDEILMPIYDQYKIELPYAYTWGPEGEFRGTTVADTTKKRIVRLDREMNKSKTSNEFEAAYNLSKWLLKRDNQKKIKEILK